MMEYYSAVNKNKLLIWITWMNLQGIRLCGKTQSQKITYCMIPLI